MKLTETEVRYVATSRTSTLPPARSSAWSTIWGTILEHMDQLAGIDTEGVEPMSQVLYETDETATLRPTSSALHWGMSWRWRMHRRRAADISKSRK